MSRPLIGQTITLPGVGNVTVQGFEKFGNTPGFNLITDKGNYLYTDSNFINRGIVFDGMQWAAPMLLNYVDQAAQVDFSGFTDIPSASNNNRPIGSSGFIFTNPEAQNFYLTGRGIDNGAFRPIQGLTRDDSGRLVYWNHYSGDAKNGVFQTEPEIGVVNTRTWSSNGKSLLGGVFGSIGEKVASSIRDVISNPYVQFAATIANPALGGAAVAGANFGTAVGSGAPIEDALKGAAVSLAAGAAGSAASQALGSSAGSIVGDTLSGAAGGATSGVVGAALTGRDLGKGLTAGVIGGAAGGAANSIVGQVFPNIDVAPDNEDIAVDTPDGGAGIDVQNPSVVGINRNNFKPSLFDFNKIDFNTLGGTFNSETGLSSSTVPLGGTGTGVGIRPPVGGGTGNPNFNTSLADLGRGGASTGGNIASNPITPESGNQLNNLVGKIGEGISQVAASTLKDFLTGLFTQTGNNLLGGNQNPLTQNPATGNNTGANMADYTGLIGNILGQNTQINRLEETANQLGGQYQNAAANLNKPFTPFNVTSAAGSSTVQGQNINSQLSANQQKLADVAGQAAGMFGDVNIPSVTGIRDTALQGTQGLLSQAQGFNPQSAAQQEFDALQQLYAPQRERDRLALENRLRAQGRLGASDNPALRQLEESFRQQDLQGAIQSRNLGFQRQQELQNLAQGMFTTGSQAAQLPTQIQAQRAQIGAQGAQASQLPFQTMNQQQQMANQLAQTQSSQGTALANIMAQLQDKGFATQGGLLSQAAALKNARDVAALQGLFGGGGVRQGAIGSAANSAIGSVLNPIGSAITNGLNVIGNSLGNLFGTPNAPYINPANMGLTAEAINQMSDEDFLQFLINGGGTFGTSEGE